MLLLTSVSQHLVSKIKDTTGDESLLDISSVTVDIMIEHASKNSNEVTTLLPLEAL